RIPIYVHSLLGALPADLWEVYFVRHGLGWVMTAAGLGFLAIVAAAFARMIARDRAARFWALGGGIALFGVCGAHPTDRHLLLISVAGAALVARFLAAWFQRRDPDQRAHLPGRGATALAVFFVVVHLVLAPILLPIRARLPGAVSGGV